MQVDLIRYRATDGVELDGALYRPTVSHPGTNVDAVLLGPGTACTFTFDVLTDIAERLAAAGYPALTINTRGHDIVWYDAVSKKFRGAAFEDIRECRFDLEGAVRWLNDAGYKRVVSLGHSLGGNKALYYAAHDPNPAVVGTVVIGSPRWSGQLFRTSAWSTEFQANIYKANAMVDVGQGKELMKMTFPFPFLITPEQYLDKYGGENFNFVTWAASIRTPVLRIDAGKDDDLILLMTKGCAEDIRRLAPHPKHRAVVVAGAQHYFDGQRDEVAAAVIDWIKLL